MQREHNAMSSPPEPAGEFREGPLERVLCPRCEAPGAKQTLLTEYSRYLCCRACGHHWAVARRGEARR